ncbi:winged helix-turn-helix domain-containing protein [Streptomyces sp. PTM05]|uniref:Winged helix-turn-helix domain-containing protein n=1 Tax=Streptantibioticus parmotrematis TaxID=2873249 RepID=A0ABS7QT02_9ACTN|nr:BTAD domain-containing putative transcriptional regulator [Streptantibioticus parmotrematis]MBY8886313.1 winged helix-turn-helix domain-containing protein [Streptantibioticus parmotrematis]
MRYSILGSTRAHRPDGTAVPLGGARLRALLAALALRPGRALPAPVLIDDVWDGDPPAEAAGALQALVARLRRAVGHAAVDSVDGGYRLCATAEDVDLHRFERLVADGGRALGEGDPAKAAGLLTDALALWGGAPLADLPGRIAYAARYEALHEDAVRLRLTAELGLGGAERVLPELSALAAAQPLNEQVQTLHIRALRDAGRGADALQAYERVRAAIADRLGADPGPELRALHAELLAPAPATPTARATPTAPDAPAAASHPAAPAPPAREAPPGRGTLKAVLTSFVGRDADLEGVRDDLAAARLVTLLGPGGSGKTRLSLEAGRRYGPQWRDGVWLVELAPLADPRAVPEAVLTALGLREIALHGSADKTLAEARGQDPVRVLAEYCARRELLLVLDNCEHVIDACAGLTERLLTECPGLSVLATSREPLGVPGELTRPVDPLPEPTALRLLADRGAAARPGFDPAEDLQACAEICRRLDGLPLAIELAAARLRSLTPRQIAGRLDDRFRLLTGGSRTVLPRQQTLRAVVDWSWELLDPAERALLRRLSVFSGGCELTAAEEVCAGDGVEARDIAGLLGSLVDRSLVIADFGARTARYRMLETIGQYAAERLTESGERAAAEARHIDCFREFARRADPKLRGPEQLEWLEKLERDHDNVRSALRRAVDSGAEQEALHLVLSCLWFWTMRNYRTELSEWPRAVAALGPDPFAEPPAPVVPLDRTPIEVPLPLPPAQLDEARRWVRMVPLSVLDEDLDLLGGDLEALGRAIRDAYPPHLPQASLRQALAVPFTAFVTHDFDAMEGMVDALVESCRAHGRVWELAYALQLRARMDNEMPGDRGAMDDVREGRELFARVGDRWGMAETLSAEAEATAFRGDWERTAGCCREAIALATELGAHQQVPELTVRLGEALVNGGNPAEGERLLREGIAEGLRQGPGAHGAAYHGRMTLAGLLGLRGETDAAMRLVDDMLGEGRPAVRELMGGMLLCLKGWLTAVAGDPARGLQQVGEGVEAVTSHDYAEVILPRLAGMVAAMGSSVLGRLVADGSGAPTGAAPAAGAGADVPDPARAGAVLLGAARAMRPMVDPLVDREELAATTRRLHDVLGDEAYEAACAEGDGLSPQEAVALLRAVVGRA